MASHTDGFSACVGQVVASDGDRRAMDFVRIAGVISQAIEDQDQVPVASFIERLAIVEAFESGQFVDVFLDQVGQPVHQLSSVPSVHTGPGALVEGPAGGLYGQIDVLFVSLGDLANHLFGRRIQCGKGFA